ncbi:hypothetical protein E2542_SST04711 [Spatholobus suberectus]|nr:hypothetical protein E2542_SST04711 [Spatholobus suberectus]
MVVRGGALRVQRVGAEGRGKLPINPVDARPRVTKEEDKLRSKGMELGLIEDIFVCETREKPTKVRWQLELGENIERKVKCLEMRKLEKGTIRMDCTLKPLTAEVEANDMTRDGVACDPKPMSNNLSHFSMLLSLEIRHKHK